MELANEGVLSTLMPGGTPMGTAVAYHLDADGQPIMQVAQGSVESANLEADQRCSLLVQPIAWPARRVGSVALTGTVAPVAPDEDAAASDIASYKLNVDTCIFTSGLEQVGRPMRGMILGDRTPRSAPTPPAWSSIPPGPPLLSSTARPCCR
jgi:hypothetical protein